MLYLFLNGVDLLTCLFYLVVLIFSATIHEIAHAWTAYKLGDPTAKHMGRITLNPKVHLTKMGTMAMLLLPIGWANPVMINPRNFRKPQRDSVLVSIAGPLSNLLLCFVSIFIFVTAEKYQTNALMAAVLQTCSMLAYINALLLVFNLIPFPPLDGSRIFTVWLPYKVREFLWRIEQYGIIVLFLIVRVFARPINWLMTFVIDGIYNFWHIFF